MPKKIILFFLVLFIGIIFIVQFPSLFIAKKVEYKSFVLFTNEGLELTEDVKNILDKVELNLQLSQFHREDLKHELYFVKGTLYESLIRLFGVKNIASSKFNKHIYLGKPNFKENILRKSDHDYEWVNLVQIISHEGVHSQMYKDYSTLGFMKTPSWINEGYSEYISYLPIRKQPNYNLTEVFYRYEKASELWVKTEYQSMTPKQYLRDRILIEYLLDVKQMSILNIINDETLDPQELLEEIRMYFQEQEPSN